MKKTFWNILENHKIEIPEIQRDYAQGRKNKKVNPIRKGFITDILDVLVDDKKQLSLDFIFGYSIDEKKQAELENNKSNLRLILSVLEQYGRKNDLKLKSKISRIDTSESNEKLLIPIDGQQRLTTLFLMHLYLGAQNEVNLDVLKRFLYRTRESSTLFLEDLVSNYNVLKVDKEEKISSIICDQEWFFNSWLKDPTVSGMLVMLEEIHSQVYELEGYDLDAMWNNLTNRDTVNFDFYDIDENDLGNDLYIKMNARGKPLNEFQNFKAWLHKKYPTERFAIDDWMTKMDKSWLDIFWNKSKEIGSVEDYFLSFFENIGLLTKSQYFNVKEISKKKIKTYFDTLGSNDFPPISYYKEENVFNTNSLNFAFTILERMSSREDIKEIDALVNEFWTETFFTSSDLDNEDNSFSSALLINFSELNLFHKAFVYGVLRFVYLMDKPVRDYNVREVRNFKNWIRISRNLIYNARIDDNTPFVIAVQAIYNLDDNILNINSFIENSTDEKWIGFFRETQRIEEREKVVELDYSWNNAICKAESHFYFYGQIQFILDLSKSENGEYNLEKFQINFKKLNYLFSRENLIDQSYKFRIQRLLLCINNRDALWMKGLSSYRWSFYSSAMANSRQRDENWRILFNQKTEYLKKVLDIPNFETLNIENYLTLAKKDIKDWRYFFIDDPRLIKVCKQRLINWTSENHIRLLGSSRLSHYHYELRTYAMYLKEFEHDENVTYCQVKRGSYAPFINLKYDGKDYQIIFERNDAIFKYKISTEEYFKCIDDKLPLISDIISNFRTFVNR